MGCTTFSVMAIEKPEIAEMFKGMIALAPAVYISNMKANAFKLLAATWRPLKVNMKIFD